MICHRYALFIGFLGGFEQLFRTEIYVDKDGNFQKLKVYVEFNCLIKPGETR